MINRHSFTISDVISVLFLVLSPFLLVINYYDYVICFAIIVVALYDLHILTIKKTKVSKRLSLSVLLLLIWALVLLLADDSVSSALIRIVQLIGCIAFFILGAISNYSLTRSTIVKQSILVVLLVIILHWIVSGLPLSQFGFIFANSNSLGSYLLVLLILFLQFPITRNDWITIVFILFMLIISGSRSSLVAALLFLSLYLIPNKTASFLNTVLLVEIGIIVVIVFYYTILQNTSLFNIINDYSVLFFNKPIDSGRNRIWPELLTLIKKRPLFGYGLSVTPQSFINTGLSSHCLYLQTILQTGVIGLALLLNTIIQIQLLIVEKSLNSSYALIVFPILLHETFEISLTQNSIVFGIIIWFLWGLGCNKNNPSVLKGV